MLTYHLRMNWHEVWGVLKWVLAVLAAGFVGQFGKSLALFFIKRHRNKKSPEAASTPTGASATAENSNQTKIEKKMAKAKVKRLKKS